MAIKNPIPSILLIILSFTSVIAQVNNTSKTSSITKESESETIFIHSNGSIFVTGEHLFYKLYCLNPNNNKTSKISKVAYVELISKDKNVVFSHKLFLDNGNGQSDFYIPNTVSTGNYKLIGYTNWIQNVSKNNFFEQDITIINPFETSPEKTVVNMQESLNANRVETNSVIETNKTQFKSREKVIVSLNSVNKNLLKGNYSISVRKKEELPENNKISALNFSENRNSSKIVLSSKTIMPEFRGELLYGKISTMKPSTNINKISVALSITGNPFVFKIVQTNDMGEFIFNIDKPYNNSEIIIQVMDSNENDFKIQLEENKLVDYNLISFNEKNKLTINHKSQIQDRSVASQIQSVYASKKTDSITNTLNNKVFYESLSKEYSLDDYTRFSTLKETITEVVSEMNYTKKDGKYYFYLKDYFAKEQLSEPSLVLFDGLLIQDVSEIINYKSANIEKIAIIPTGYNYGPKVFNGLISIFSKKDSTEKPNFNESAWLKKQLKTPETIKSYYKQDYSDANKFSRIPDYRYQLLWEPNATSNEISFYTSDITGIFEIIIEGFAENGEPLSGKKYFEVK